MEMMEMNSTTEKTIKQIVVALKKSAFCECRERVDAYIGNEVVDKKDNDDIV